jgi:hypothetical protein
MTDDHKTGRSAPANLSVVGEQIEKQQKLPFNPSAKHDLLVLRPDHGAHSRG